MHYRDWTGDCFIMSCSCGRPVRRLFRGRSEPEKWTVDSDPEQLRGVEGADSDCILEASNLKKLKKCKGE